MLESMRSCISSQHPVANSPIASASSSAAMSHPYNRLMASSNAFCVMVESISSGCRVISFALLSSHGSDKAVVKNGALSSSNRWSLYLWPNATTVMSE